MRFPTWMDLSWLFPVIEPAKPDMTWPEHEFYEDRLGRVNRAHDTVETLDDARRRLAIVISHRNDMRGRIDRLREAHGRFSHLLPKWKLLTAEKEALEAKLRDQT